jgi:hypothetical protein
MQWKSTNIAELLLSIMPYNGNAAVVINKTVLSLKELAVWERTR